MRAHPIETAIDEIENAIDELREREFFVGYDEYKLIGRLSKKQFNALSNEILRQVAAGQWDFDRDILTCIEKYLPDVRMKVIED